MDRSLGALLAYLETLRGRMPQHELGEMLTQLDVTCDELVEYIHFSEDRYRRSFVQTGSWHELFVLCWRSGQRSPIHDHTGSSCGMRVLRGTATEQDFLLRPNGQLQPGEVHEYPAGSVATGSEAYMHQVANLQPDADLITLHLYSPPLLNSRNYFLPDSVASAGMRLTSV
jgi:cysteine dioxygenase